MGTGGSGPLMCVFAVPRHESRTVITSCDCDCLCSCVMFARMFIVVSTATMVCDTLHVATSGRVRVRREVQGTWERAGVARGVGRDFCCGGGLSIRDFLLYKEIPYYRKSLIIGGNPLLKGGGASACRSAAGGQVQQGADWTLVSGAPNGVSQLACGPSRRSTWCAEWFMICLANGKRYDFGIALMVAWNTL